MATQTELDFLDAKNWLRAKQLAELLHCKPQSIYNTIAEGGDLPPRYKRGSMTLFYRPEVEQWLRQRTVRVERACKPARQMTSTL